jgi:carboxylate-amine ligase
MNYIQYSRALINENKWRASRYGIDGHLIDFGKEEEVNTRALIYELLDFIDDVVDPLGSRQATHYAEHMLETGTGADRQLKVYDETGSLMKVMEYVAGQFLAGI